MTHVRPEDLTDPAEATALVEAAYDPSAESLYRKATAKRREIRAEAEEKEEQAETHRKRAKQLREHAKEAASENSGEATGLLDEANEEELRAESLEEEAEEVRARIEEEVNADWLDLDEAKGRVDKRIRADHEDWMARLAVAYKRLELVSRRFEAWSDALPGWSSMRHLSGVSAPTVSIGPNTCSTWNEIWAAFRHEGVDLEAAEEEARAQLDADVEPTPA